MFTKKYKIVHAMMVAFVAISMFAFSSCELESSDNGKLDGFWHLESIDSLENGKTVDMSKLLSNDMYCHFLLEHRCIAQLSNLHLLLHVMLFHLGAIHRRLL